MERSVYRLGSCKAYRKRTATKYRYPFLTTEDIRNRLWEHIEAYAESKGIHVLAVGGYDDHCHCLVSLHAEQSASKIAGLLKGESSYWINKSGLIRDVSKREKFNWQEKYFVESISPNDLRNVIHYITNIIISTSKKAAACFHFKSS